MTRVGLAVAVRDAHPRVRGVAHWVTRRRGGRGAVREVAERLLKVKGLWPDVLARYFSSEEA
jgi:3-deoxy-D-manno-octulosonate 8-phosphate phosphatase (KDO 8-P phosphatase)